MIDDQYPREMTAQVRSDLMAYGAAWLMVTWDPATGKFSFDRIDPERIQILDKP